MRIIVKILAGLVGLIVVLTIIAFFLPRTIMVERSISINAPASTIFTHVNSGQAAGPWSPWLGRDPEVVINYSGPESGVGNTMTWTSEHPQVGNGSQVISESVENEKVVNMLDFGPSGGATAMFLLAADGDATQVTWSFETDMGMNPIGRWMGLMMDKWVGGDYETGLAQLKTLVEAG